MFSPTTLPASDVYAWAKAATKPSYTFSEIGSKPTTLSGYGITDAMKVYGRDVTNCNAYASTMPGTHGFEASPTNCPSGSAFSAMLSVSNWDVGLQIVGGYTSNRLWFRGWSDTGTKFYQWNEVLSTANYNEKVPSLTGIGASGTWGISITGNAATVGGVANGRLTANSVNNIATVIDANQGQVSGTGYNGNGITYWRGTNNTANIPSGSSNAWGILNLGMGGNHGTSYQYAAQIFVGTQGTGPYFRRQGGSTFSVW